VWSQYLAVAVREFLVNDCMQLQSIFAGAGNSVRRVAVVLGRGASLSFCASSDERTCSDTNNRPLSFYICDGSHASGVFESAYRFREAYCFFISDASPSAHLLLSSTMLSPSDYKKQASIEMAPFFV
jgi:hypothetical protein